MKLTIKTLQQKLFQIDVEPTESVGEIKSKIQQEHNHPVEQQKLIYSGKVLDDGKIVSECNFKEKDFLVLMVSKPKSTPAASSSAAASSRAAPSPAPPAPGPAPATPSQPSAVPPVADTGNATPAPVTPVAPSGTEPSTGTEQAPATSGPVDTSFVTGSALEASISNMMEMGFPRDQVLRALRASFNNPDRAVEYLFNGIPEGLLAEAAPPPAASRAPAAPGQATGAGSGAPSAPAAAPAAAAAPQAGSQNLFQMAQQQQQQQPRGAGGLGAGGLGALGGLGAGAGAGAAGGGLDALRNSDAMANLRQRVIENPALLQHAVQAVAQQNPQVAEYLNANPELLLQMLSGQMGDLEGDEGDAPEGVQTISLTQEEMDAIERLQALGFTRQQAAEAYLACGKNEELAANYLFESNFDD